MKAVSNVLGSGGRSKYRSWAFIRKDAPDTKTPTDTDAVSDAGVTETPDTPDAAAAVIEPQHTEPMPYGAPPARHRLV